MAIKINLNTVYGITIESAYHRIDNISITNKTKMVFHVYIYADNTKAFFAEKMFNTTFDLSGENPIKQAYEYLKTLPEFANATDC